MTQCWNPSVLLDVNPAQGHTCTGKTLRRVRCQNAVNKADRSTAGVVLNKLSRIDVVSTGINELIQRNVTRLAELTLCIRNHRGLQTEKVAAGWISIIREFVSERRIERRRARQDVPVSSRAIPRQQYFPEAAIRERLIQLAPQVIVPQRQYISAVIASQPRARELQRDPEPQVIPRRRNMPEPVAYQPRPLVLPSSPPAQNIIPRQRDTLPKPAPVPVAQGFDSIENAIHILERAGFDVSELVQNINRNGLRDAPRDVQRNSRRNIRRDDELPAAVTREGLREQERNSAAAQQPAPVPAPTPAVVRPQPRPNVNPDRQSVRKPLDDACYVCYEHFDGPDSTEWCRTCGQNIHVECFDQWNAGKTVRNITCGYCRSRWYAA